MSGGNGQTITVCGNVFRLVETIGRGSYGTVHKAINLSSGAAVAVKLIGKDKLRRPHERQSIEKEIETMRVAVEKYENGHPHIVRLLCTKESQHHIFIVLEYCAGGDLATLMKANHGLTEEQARLFMSQLASGLQFLRSQNVVHRDFKPANLLLSSKNIANAKLKIGVVTLFITDFGFARQLQSESLAESVVGSPLYMAPELLEYKSYDAKADLWSVGIILYEMLVNDHPFLVVDNCHATNHLALRRNIQRYYERYGRLRLPARISVSPECEELVEGLLRVDPRQRISFEDFFRASFLLPPLPADTSTATDLANSTNKQALVAENQPEYDEWAAFSDEYVIVDNEFEDVGRKVLDGHNLNTELEEKLNEMPRKVVANGEKAVPRTPDLAVRPIPPASPAQTTASTIEKDSCVVASSPPVAVHTVDTHGIIDVVVDTSTPRNSMGDHEQNFESKPQTAAVDEIVSKTENWLVGERKEWVTDDIHLEELLGICYKSFSCGSIGLFVPTPFGDYIAFHEGCPHYYLSMESIAASERDGRNPPYVLGCIVFIEDYVTSAESNPFNLREGTKYHIVTVTPLSSSESGANDGMGAGASSIEDELPLSQVLTSRSPRNEPPTNSFSSVQAVANASTTQHQRISFRSFHISHLALFFLKGGKLPYVAFNEGAPHYYLANESLQAAMQSEGDGSDKTPPAYICGEIIFIDTFQATEDFNPYRLPYGTRFHVVTVANPKKT
ncbi:Ulk/ulk protein kinase, partial [Globisporangium splendens]